jgi:ribose-phosphate pyrophosphokinase
VTAVIPYYGYARQDRKDEGRVPITAKLVANLITRAGADRVLTMDLHAPQIQGFFDCPVDHLYAAPVLNSYFLSKNLQPENLVIVSPDEGSIKRALAHKKRLGGSLAVVDKVRSSPTETKQNNIIGGPVTGKIALMFDDMISTGGSIVGAADKLTEAGAKEVHVAATHGLLCGPAYERLAESSIKTVVLTDSIPLRPEPVSEKIVVMTCSKLLGEAIKRIHQDESISALFKSEA